MERRTFFKALALLPASAALPIKTETGDPDAQTVIPNPQTVIPNPQTDAIQAHRVGGQIIHVEADGKIYPVTRL